MEERGYRTRKQIYDSLVHRRRVELSGRLVVELTDQATGTRFEYAMGGAFIFVYPRGAIDVREADGTERTVMDTCSVAWAAAGWLYRRGPYT